MNKEQVNQVFTQQAIRGNRISELDKELFNLTFDFTLQDWKQVQTEEYFREADAKTTEWDRKKYKIAQVKKYIRSQI